MDEKSRLPVACVWLMIAIISFAIPRAVCGDDWKQWRGNQQTGVAAEGKFPQRWSEQQGTAWKSEVPGLGGSTPVISGHFAYLTSGYEGQNHLHCYDLADGKKVWSIKAGEDRGAKHRKGGGANPSAVTDGNVVVAYFRSGDLIAVDATGKTLWEKNLQKEFGEDTLWWDLGTSPLLTAQAVIVAVMQTGPSYLVSFDKTTGDVLWRTDRVLDAPEEAAQSYATPLAATIEGREIVAVMGADHLTLHAMNDGKELAQLGGFNPKAERFFRSIASPVISGSIIVCPYSRGGTLTAVSLPALLAGKGNEAIVWHRDDLGSDVPTPASHDGKIYVCGDKGQVTALNSESGKTLWSVTLPKSRNGFSSSPLVAGNRLYVTREDATTFVIGPLNAEQPEVQAANELADNQPFTVASVVPTGDSLLIRTKSNLYLTQNAK